jgi:gamma-glutamylputrescine oxidase
MDRAPYVNSYYVATRHHAPERPQLTGAVECDVCVVGGGIAGCSAALHLAERGYRVILLEQHRIGWGASGRSGAQVIAGISCGQDKLERLVGAGDAKRVWDMTVEGVDLMRSLIARHGIDCDWVDGHMQVAIKPRQDTDLRHEQETLRDKYDYSSLRYLSREEVASVLATSRYSSGLYDSNGAHIHCLNYVLGLAAAAERCGARIHEMSRAVDYTEGSTVRVRTERGEVKCKQLVFCGNAWLGSTAPTLLPKIINVGTYIVATEPLGAERAQQLIRNNAAVSDLNWIIDYFRRSADHRLLFGGRVNYSGLGAFDAPSATLKRMLAVFPQLAGVKLEFAWGGDLDITLNRAPHFGRLAPNVYFLQGFSGHGIVLTGIAGKVVAEAMSGTAERFDVFARIPHADFPGGAALRRPALVLAMLYYRIRDML